MAPAHTVTSGWRAMASRSADTSPVTSAPRCTPPMPPVANTAMPAACGQGERRRHRRGAVGPALGDGDRQIALGRLARRAADAACSLGSSPTRATPSSTAVSAGTAPAGAHRGEAALERLGVGRTRQAEVGEDRRLQRHHRPAAGQRRLHLVGHDGLQAVAHPAAHGPAPGAAARWRPARCPARTASTSRRAAVHATRKPAAKASPAPVVSARPRHRATGTAWHGDGRRPDDHDRVGTVLHDGDRRQRRAGQPERPRPRRRWRRARPGRASRRPHGTARRRSLEHGHARRVDAHRHASRPCRRRQVARRWRRSARRSASRPADGAR